MTIFFVIANDIPTKINLEIAKRITSSNDIKIFEHNATHINLFDAIKKNPNHPIMIMSHGSTHSVIDHNNISAISEKDAPDITQKTIFAWACHTGSKLGHEISKNNNVWLGYDCAVTAPDDRELYIGIFSNLFSSIKTKFPEAIDSDTAKTTLNQIKYWCDQAITQLDAVSASEDEDVISLYSCCHQIWQRLCIWLPNQSDPEKHPEAPPPRLSYNF